MTETQQNGGAIVSRPGTTVIKKQDEKSELWIYVKQAALGALAVEAALVFILIMLLCIGWPSLVLAFAAIGWLTHKVISWTVQNILARRRLFRAFIISYIAVFIVFGHSWWQFIIGRDMLLPLLERIVNVFLLPMWAYGLLLVAWFLAALKQRGKVTAAFLSFALLLYAGYMLPQVNWTPLLVRVRYITPVFLLSPILFSVVLGLVMLKEMLLPNFDITLVPLKFGEYVDAGGIFGILKPRIKRALPNPRIKIERLSNGGNTLEIYEIPGGSRAIEFYQAVLNGATFNNKTARMNRKGFNAMYKDPFMENGLIEENTPGVPQQGVHLTDEGRQELEKAVNGEFVEEWDD